jgi:phage baseplate assembly protein W
MATAKDFVGKGFAFPFRFDQNTGGVRRDRGTGEAQRLTRIKWSVRQISGVKRGELFGARRFGMDLRGLIFHLDSRGVEQRAELAVTRALEDPRYGEGRLIVDRVNARLDRTTGIMQVDLESRLGVSNTSVNLVYPLYLGGAERDAAQRGLET